MSEPEMDEDGYPTEETLSVVTKWEGDFTELLKYVSKAWRYYPDYWTEKDGVSRIFEEPVRRYHISTAGWSGNESLISALRRNRVFWMMHWEQSNRGGHYIFEIRKENPDAQTKAG
jgi:hypothetical protein